MTLGQILADAAIGVEIITDIEVDNAQLEAGNEVTIPEIEVGTTGGKAIYLKATLSTTK